ncbi:unnamed protein product, partial [Pelagomonas calceolata]
TSLLTLLRLRLLLHRLGRRHRLLGQREEPHESIVVLDLVHRVRYFAHDPRLLVLRDVGLFGQHAPREVHGRRAPLVGHGVDVLRGIRISNQFVDRPGRRLLLVVAPDRRRHVDVRRRPRRAHVPPHEVAHGLLHRHLGPLGHAAQGRAVVVVDHRDRVLQHVAHARHRCRWWRVAAPAAAAATPAA